MRPDGRPHQTSGQGGSSCGSPGFESNYEPPEWVLIKSPQLGSDD